MIKQWSAAVLVVALLGHGVAYAQPEGQQYRDPKACHTLQAEGKITPWPAACEYVPDTSKKARKQQEKNEKQMKPYLYRDFSPKLQVVGGVTTLIGVLMMIPQGTTYHIFGDAVCVTDYSIDHGSCGDRTVMGIGALTAAAGLTMLAIGSVDVRIKSNITPKQKAVAVALTW